MLEKARVECGSFAAWLAAATSMALCGHQKAPAGRILLNLPILRDEMERLGGFGFGMGSLLMPVKLDLARMSCQWRATFSSASSK